MEVQLKKTKITSNIVKQSLSGNYGLMLNNSNYDILGWCLHDKRRKVLMYNRLSNQVVTFTLCTKHTSSKHIYGT